MARSLNRVQLIGNLTRDPELRYTPNGTAVCSFGLATNRTWTTDTGEKHEETEFHRIVAWNKLAELCSQFLAKGRKVYVEGRLSTRTWQAQDGTQRSSTEIVIDDMILLDSKRPGRDEEPVEGIKPPKETASSSEEGEKKEPSRKSATHSSTPAKKNTEGSSSLNGEEEVAPDDIPF